MSSIVYCEVISTVFAIILFYFFFRFSSDHFGYCSCLFRQHKRTALSNEWTWKLVYTLYGPNYVNTHSKNVCHQYYIVRQQWKQEHTDDKQDTSRMKNHLIKGWNEWSESILYVERKWRGSEAGTGKPKPNLIRNKNYSKMCICFSQHTTALVELQLSRVFPRNEQNEEKKTVFTM